LFRACVSLKDGLKAEINDTLIIYTNPDDQDTVATDTNELGYSPAAAVEVFNPSAIVTLVLC